MCREAVDDIRRLQRDREVNSQKYKKLTRQGLISIASSRICVGDLITVEKVLDSCLKRKCLIICWNILSTDRVYASSVCVLKNRIDNILVRAGYI